MELLSRWKQSKKPAWFAVTFGSAWWFVQLLDALQIVSAAAGVLGEKGPDVMGVIRSFGPPVILAIGFGWLYWVGRKTSNRDDLREKVEAWYDARARAAYVAARDLLKTAGDRGSSAPNGETIRGLLRDHVILPAQNFRDPFERAVRGEGGAVDTELMSQWLTHYGYFIKWTSILHREQGVSIVDAGQYQKWKELHDKLVDYTPVVLAGGKCTNIRRDCERTFDEINRLRIA